MHKRNASRHTAGRDDAVLNLLLDEARREACHRCAEAMAARLESLAAHITRRRLSHVEAAELLRAEAETLQHAVQEVH